jgi:hypothetical protein
MRSIRQSLAPFLIAVAVAQAGPIEQTAVMTSPSSPSPPPATPAPPALPAIGDHRLLARDYAGHIFDWVSSELELPPGAILIGDSGLKSQVKP